MFRIICCLGTGIVLLTAVQLASAGGDASSSSATSDQANMAAPSGSQGGASHAATSESDTAKSGIKSDASDDTGSASAMPDSDKAAGQDRSADLPVDIRGVVMELFPECQVIGVQFNNGMWEIRVFQGDELWEASFSEQGELLKKSKSDIGIKKAEKTDKTDSSDMDDDDSDDDGDDNDNDNDDR